MWHGWSMTDKKNNLQDSNLIGTSVDAFADYYNKNIPRDFPRATPKALAEFHKSYPSLFKDDKWIINKHRKKLMDWLVSHGDK
jgi:hypothetical protein